MAKNQALAFLSTFQLLWTPLLATDKSRPNVLFIAIDDLNTSAEGFRGETTVPTPHLSRLAKMGVRFINAHCAAPACNPSRIAVLTGLAPSTTGVYLNQQDWRKCQKLKNWTTLPGHFRNHGYKTLGGGKIYHASSLREQAYTGYLDPKPWDDFFPSKERQMPEEIKPERIPMHGNKSHYRGHFDWAQLQIATDEMADAKVVHWACEQLSKDHSKPLFLAVGIYRPHIPWWTPKTYFDRHPIDQVPLPQVPADDLDDIPEVGLKMRKQGWHQWLVDHQKWRAAAQAYYASVSFADDMVGRLLDALAQGPMAHNTIVILWSDHGYHLGQKEHWEKFALWEQATRVPLIIAAPGSYQIGHNCAQPVSLLDIYPTLSELCMLPMKNSLDGESLVPLLKNPTLPSERIIITTHGFSNHAARSNTWRLIRYHDGSEELYHQQADPQNFHNLASLAKYQSIKSQLSQSFPKTNASPNPPPKEKATWKK